MGEAGDEWYTEIAARELLKEENIAILRSIPKITRKKSYKTEGRKELAETETYDIPRRNEEWLAKTLHGKTLNYIGEIIDFQTPLKNNENDPVGTVDLLSYNKLENTAYILELKKSASVATLLKCVLQAYTYWKTVDGEKLLSDFGINSANLRNAAYCFSLPVRVTCRLTFLATFAGGLLYPNNKGHNS
jgi:hypothetical protein